MDNPSTSSRRIESLLRTIKSLESECQKLERYQGNAMEAGFKAGAKINALESKVQAIEQEILKKVEDYKVSKELKQNNTGADYIFVYDLKTFCLSPNDSISASYRASSQSISMIQNIQPSASRFKFRAWDTATKEMMDGIHNYPNSFSDCLQDEDYILMQSTGLVDKNGKEIYEGDIVDAIGIEEYKSDSCIQDVMRQEDGAYFVRSNKGATHGLPLLWGGWESLKVIGNIYEHNHLLPID